MPRTKVAILNINDVEAYVRSHLPKGVLMSPETREDLVQTGLVLISEMETKYNPGLGGQDPATSTFSGYVEGQHLEDKLRDCWHRCEGHRLASDGNGGREWVYPTPPASLDQIHERDGNLDAINALTGSDTYESDLGSKLRRAATEHFIEIIDRIVAVGELLGEEVPVSVIANDLGLRDKEIVETLKYLRALQPRMTIMEAE